MYEVIAGGGGDSSMGRHWFKSINPFASGIQKVLLYPHNGIIFSENSEKISSHYKFLCQWYDNQINTSFIEISRIKRLFFFIVVVFLPHN